MDELILCKKDIKCTSGNDLNFNSATLTPPPLSTITATTPFTPILYVTINTEKMNNPKILFKFSGILSYTVTATSTAARGILLANSYIRISRKIDDVLVPVSQNFAKTNLFSLLNINAIRPQTDSNSFVFNFCHSPQNCNCSNITYALEASSILTINPNALSDGNTIRITGSLYNNELLTIAYDCE